VIVTRTFRKLLEGYLATAIRSGNFTVYWPDGSSTIYGDGREPRAAVEIKNAVTLRRLVLNPALTLGETYMDEGIAPVDERVQVLE
jgi:cyclopropane-fatty-acyl-phospholipid synthase